MSDYGKLLAPIDSGISLARSQVLEQRANQAAKAATQPVEQTRALKDLRHKETSLAEQEKAAQQFEALLVQEMMKSMWASVPSQGLLSGSREESYYRDMLSEALADDISKGQGIGIKQVVMREFMRRQEK